MIAVIDNYDSFTYNLVQYLKMLGAEVRVVRNDAVTVEEVRGWNPRGIVISPGPCRPEDAGISIPSWVSAWGIRRLLRHSEEVW